jgi:hypothetical protein
MAKPGNECLLKSKTFDTKVFIVKIHKENEILKGYDVVLIPEEIEDKCYGKEYANCVRDFGGGYANPTRILKAFLPVESISDVANAKLKEIEARMDKYGKERILKANSITVKVAWELWSNGENFRIIENEN